MVTWGNFRSQIQRSILKDEGAITWSTTALLDCLGWALDLFVSHTAAVTSTTIEPETDEVTYDLPSNLFESPDSAGAVYTVSGTSRTYFKPLFLNPEVELEEGFYIQGSEITFLQAPTETINLLYYAYYNKPASDSDVIGVPNWALAPLANLVGYFAMSKEARASANLQRFREDPEKGTPLDNPIIQQQDQFWKLYEQQLARFHPQSRQFFVGE